MIRGLSSTLVIAALVLSACRGSGPDRAIVSPPPEYAEPAAYVALGDSYVSGPGIAPVDEASKDCMRSTEDWPAQVARTLKVPSFRDVSCSGASTDQFTGPTTLKDGSEIPPQLGAVSRETRLVTVGVGGNNQGVFTGLLGLCAVPVTSGKDLCTPFVRDMLPAALKKVTADVSSVLKDLRKMTPRAKILLVGYLRVAPESGSCKDAGLSRRQIKHSLEGEEALDASLSKAAKKAGVDYLSLRRMSTGHDVCAGDDAWINGVSPSPGDGALLHPNAAGTRAVAEAVAHELGSIVTKP